MVQVIILQGYLFQLFSKAGAKFKYISSHGGIDLVRSARKYNFLSTTTNNNDIFQDNESENILIATRHDSHSELIIRALKAKKNVFVEKPLCLKAKELEDIKKAYTGDNILMVGFNRRFSPFIQKIKNYLEEINEPKSFVYTCNAGFIPREHWIHDPDIGGGRLIGEACHFVDLLRFLDSTKIESISINQINNKYNPSDTFTLNLIFKSGSIGTIHYFSNGHKSFKKERLEIFADNSVIVLDNYKKLSYWGENKKLKGFSLIQQNKGQVECAKAFIKSVKEIETSPIPINEIFEVQNLILDLEKHLL